MKTRFFRTPVVASKFVDNPAAIYCWRGCGKVGNRLHVFWDCPRMLGFWKGVKSKIDKYLGIDILFTPGHFLLDLSPEGTHTRAQNHLLHILLVTARKVMTIYKWMNPQWKRKLREVYGMEALIARLQLRSDVFERMWLPIARYLSN